LTIFKMKKSHQEDPEARQKEDSRKPVNKLGEQS
jgi:hypothetical protein